jgi:5-methyltetrahydrofolate--homocysteine methyltransferase
LVLEELKEAIIDPDPQRVEELVKKALDQGTRPGEIITKGLIKGMEVVGERFKKNEMFIPEVVMSANAMHAGLEVLRPLLTEGEFEAKGTLVIATVKNDVHDIGKNLVAMVFEGAGFKVVDLGVDVAPEKIAVAIEQENANLVGLSTLLTSTLVSAKDTVNILKEKGMREKVKIMVGGAAVTQSFADEIGADGYAEDANRAVDVAKKLLGID